MNFPKPYMKTSELMKLGLPQSLLRRAYGTKGQRFATKLDPRKRNSHLIFDTEGLNEWLNREMRSQDLGMIRK